MKYLEASYRMHDPDLIFIQNEPLFDFLHPTRAIGHL